MRQAVDKPKPPKSEILKEEREAIKSLEGDNKIIFTADKGKCFCGNE